MSQSTFALPNQPRSSYRTAVNAALQALATANSGATAPTETYPYMWWADTANNRLKQRNAADDAWVEVLVLSTGAPVAGLTAASVSTLTNKTITDSTNTVYASAGPSGSAFSFRNKIIGGDFTTNPWQRGTSFTNPTNTSYTADRWYIGRVDDAQVNVLKTADAPTAAEAGVFTRHCYHVDVTTADASIAAGQLFVVRQRVEGFNAAPFGFGQAGTRYVTLSFWHKHTKTGTYCVSISNSAGNRSYVAEYTQDVSDTWEKATITIPVDTTGTWLYDSGVGLNVLFVLMCGTEQQTTSGSWQAGSYAATSNQVNALDSTANNFKIALVQLEAGSVATPFETRPIGTELALCQRYYENSYNLGVAPATVTTVGALQSAANGAGSVEFAIQYKVAKRATPTTITHYSPATGTATRIRNDSGAADVTANTANAGMYGHRCYGSLSANATGSVHFTSEAEL